MEGCDEKENRMNWFDCLKRKLLFVSSLVLAMICSADGSANRISSLCMREFEFDYCGLLATNRGGVKGLFFDIEKLKYKTDIPLREDFQKVLEGLECSAVKSDVSAFEQSLTSVQRMLEGLFNEALSDKCKFARLFALITRVEYTFVRISELNGVAFLSEEIIISTIPDKYFELDYAKRSAAVRVRRFRDLIRVSVAIKNYERIRNKLPDSIGELDLPECIIAPSRGVKCYYQHENDVWVLRYSGSCFRPGPQDFNSYVPEMDIGRISRFPYPEILFLSSDFSLKRRMLFYGETINAKNNQWRCRMIGGELNPVRN